MTASAGIHHVTAICSDPKRNVAFYTHNLGLRLVKKTVNFDDPSTWHLYYGDETGQPGTALTFFAWGKVPAGRNGNGMAVETAFIIPERSLGYWTQRLVERGISHEAPEKRFGETVLPLSDPDGMRLALVAVTGADLPTTPPRRIWSRRSRRGAFAPPTRSIAAISARSTFASRAACCSRSQRMTRASRSTSRRRRWAVQPSYHPGTSRVAPRSWRRCRRWRDSRRLSGQGHNPRRSEYFYLLHVMRRVFVLRKMAAVNMLVRRKYWPWPRKATI